MLPPCTLDYCLLTLLLVVLRPRLPAAGARTGEPLGGTGTRVLGPSSGVGVVASARWLTA